MHLRTSALHNTRQYTCPGRGCGRSFVAYADLALHVEAGRCPSGATRAMLNDVVVQYDRYNVVTNPFRLIEYDEEPRVLETLATEDAWNGEAYECVLCYRTFPALPALNAHLRSPVHDESIYRCPSQYQGCDKPFKTLSGILSHIERGGCGVTRFRRQIIGVVDNVTQNVGRLTMY